MSHMVMMVLLNKLVLLMHRLNIVKLLLVQVVLVLVVLLEDDRLLAGLHQVVLLVLSLWRRFHRRGWHKLPLRRKQALLKLHFVAKKLCCCRCRRVGQCSVCRSGWKRRRQVLLLKPRQDGQVEVLQFHALLDISVMKVLRAFVGFGLFGCPRSSGRWVDGHLSLSLSGSVGVKQFLFSFAEPNAKWAIVFWEPSR